MAPKPDLDIATALAVGGVVTLRTPPGGTVAVGYGVAPSNIVTGPIRAADTLTVNQMINIMNTGGPPPEPIMNAGGNIFRARVQVMVRSKVDQFDAGQDLARACLRKLHLATIAGYTDVMAQETEPNYIGPDERQVHYWTFNLLARWVE